MCLVLLVLIIVDFVILVGRGVVMGLPRDHGRVLRRFSWMSCCSSFSTLPGLPVRCLLVHLPNRYCAAWFASKVPTWRLPVCGHAVGLVTACPRVADDGGAEVASREVDWVSSSGPGRKRVRLNSKTPAHLAESRPRVLKRLRYVGHYC